ncbi:MAG: hypothetical protein HS111_23230 [Kofleriaceae bacterium]|nr:hypothetical protein [Kofleriaceae bacterium]
MRGGEIVRLRQAVDGIPVERGELRVLIGPGGALLAASGVPVPAALPRDGGAFVHGRSARAARRWRARSPRSMTSTPRPPSWPRTPVPASPRIPRPGSLATRPACTSARPARAAPGTATVTP